MIDMPKLFSDNQDYTFSWTDWYPRTKVQSDFLKPFLLSGSYQMAQSGKWMRKAPRNLMKSPWINCVLAILCKQDEKQLTSPSTANQHLAHVLKLVIHCKRRVTWFRGCQHMNLKLYRIRIPVTWIEPASQSLWLRRSVMKSKPGDDSQNIAWQKLRIDKT